MHRQCRIIHTDFKPENVVIGLRDEEVAEIAQTGQLTTTKMFEGGDHNRKLNMRVAGTLPINQTKRVSKKEQKQDPSEEEKAADMAKAMEGMTAKQKKNFRKKQARKRKKAEQSRVTSQLDISKDEKTEKSEDDEVDLDINFDIDLKKGPSKEAKKKIVKAGS